MFRCRLETGNVSLHGRVRGRAVCTFVVLVFVLCTVDLELLRDRPNGSLPSLPRRVRRGLATLIRGREVLQAVSEHRRTAIRTLYLYQVASHGFVPRAINGPSNGPSNGPDGAVLTDTLYEYSSLHSSASSVHCLSNLVYQVPVPGACILLRCPAPAPLPHFCRPTLGENRSTE